MQAIIRERIVEQLMEVPALVDQYLRHDHQFVGQTLRWLRETEHKLQNTRSTVVSELAALRGLAAASEDGYVDPNVSAAKSSSRKSRRVMVVHTLSQAESALRRHVEFIDVEFNNFRDKLSQLLAVTSTNSPLPPPKTIDSHYIDTVWEMLKHAPENQSLYFYLQARLTVIDRRYLLQDLLHNLLDSI
jgi:hypothetical protein